MSDAQILFEGWFIREEVTNGRHNYSKVVSGKIRQYRNEQRDKLKEKITSQEGSTRKVTKKLKREIHKLPALMMRKETHHTKREKTQVPWGRVGGSTQAGHEQQ